MAPTPRQPHRPSGNWGKRREPLGTETPAQRRFLSVSAGSGTRPICPYEAEVGGSSPSTPTKRNPCSAGVSARSGELDNGVVDRLRTRIGRDLLCVPSCPVSVHDGHCGSGWCVPGVGCGSGCWATVDSAPHHRHSRHLAPGPIGKDGCCQPSIGLPLFTASL